MFPLSSQIPSTIRCMIYITEHEGMLLENSDAFFFWAATETRFLKEWFEFVFLCLQAVLPLASLNA